MTIHRRPYQRKILNDPHVLDIVLGIEAGSGKADGLSTLVVAPTGSGKTVMFASLAEYLDLRHFRVLILTHRQEILEQILSSLYGLGVVCGQISATAAVTQDSIQVGMVQTVVKRLARLRRPDLIVADEAHHYQAGTNEWGKVLEYWRDVPRLGFTATPELLSGVGLGASYKRLVLGPSTADLVDWGWLASPRMLCAPSDLLGVKYHVRRGDFDAAEQAAKVRERRVVGDQIEQYRQYFRGDPCVGFAPTLEIAAQYVEAFRSAGFRASMVRGGMDKTERDRAFRELGDGTLNILWNHSIITEGVDVPVTRGVLLLRRTQSLALFLQMCGRSLRPLWPAGFDPNTATDAERRAAIVRAGKPDALILDPVGNWQIHGHVLSPREWSLEAKSRAERQERTPTITKCPQCYAVWPGTPRRCPDCGYDFTASGHGPDVKLTHVAGELVEIGVERATAQDLGGLYDAAMSANTKERAQMLARKGVELLNATKYSDESPTAAAWRARGGRA